MAFDDALPRRLARWVTAEPDWDLVYREQLPRVCNFFRYRLGSAADAEDLTARTFEKAWRARHRSRRDLAGFSTWLLAIARHVAVDHLRARRPHMPLEVVRSLASPAQTPEQAVMLSSEAERLATLLATLPERERELPAFKYGAEMTNRAIARLTGLSESNVGTIVHRAVETLRRAHAAERMLLGCVRSEPHQPPSAITRIQSAKIRPMADGRWPMADG